MTAQRRWLTALVLSVAALPLFARGAPERIAPTLALPNQDRAYISPANADGVQDELVVDFDQVVTPAEGALIVEYILTVFDDNGNEVFVLREAEEVQRRRSQQKSVSLPDSIRWDGTYGGEVATLPDGARAGDAVPDGDYTYQVTFVDNTGAFVRSSPFALTIDNEAPLADQAPTDVQIFSPNGDGVYDDIALTLVGSREQRWTVEVLDRNGAVVYAATIENESGRPRDDVTPPDPFVWDGSTDAGRTAIDGEYTLRLTGQDRAGNAVAVDQPITIVVDTRGIDAGLRLQPAIRAISPNDDGVQDHVQLSIDPIAGGRVDSWQVSVSLDGRELEVVSVAADETGAGSYLFDGRRQDGTVRLDGAYELHATARLANGAEIEAGSVGIAIDTVPPTLGIEAQTAPLPSDTSGAIVIGAGQKARLVGSVTFDPADRWATELRIDGRPYWSGSDGELAQFLASLGLRPEPTGDGRARVEFAWDGTVPGSGERAPDAIYELAFSGSDAAGNVAPDRLVRVRKDSRTPTVAIAVDAASLDLARAGAARTFTFEYGPTDLVDEFLFDIVDERGRVVRSEYIRRPLDRFAWDGSTNNGNEAPNGIYRGRLRVVYLNGYHDEAVTGTTVAVQGGSGSSITGDLAITAGPEPFSPDGDGTNDVLSVRIENRRDAVVSSWVFEVRDRFDDVIYRRADLGELPPVIEWTGTTSDDRPLLSAETYTLFASAAYDDGAQETAERDLHTGIIVVRDGDRLLIRIAGILFAPNSSDLFASPRVELSRNLRTLQALAEVSTRFPDRQIVVEGHATHVFNAPPARKVREQREELLPLSRNRAREVFQALVILGVDPNRLSIVGRGGDIPIVPHTDTVLRRRNRRVEFMLE